MNASGFGIPRLRPRVAFVAVKHDYKEHFYWPEESQHCLCTVEGRLYKLMAANGWKGADPWGRKAKETAPTIGGGSHKHGGPDLGSTRARRAWATLGVDGLGIANKAPVPDFPTKGMAKLTVQMVDLLLGFPENWYLSGGKTEAYRQVANAFPTPIAKAVAESLRAYMMVKRSAQVAE